MLVITISFSLVFVMGSPYEGLRKTVRNASPFKITLAKLLQRGLENIARRVLFLGWIGLWVIHSYPTRGWSSSNV